MTTLNAAALRSLASLTGTPPQWDLDPPPVDPVVAFTTWLGHAIDHAVPEAHAMTLSTVDAAGVPDARVLIVKGVHPDGRWAFAGDGASSKGQQLNGRPAAALTFYWPSLVRSVRIRGPVRPADPTASAADFEARSASARAIALAGPSGQPLDSTAEQDRAVNEAARRLATGHPTPHDWTLWWLHADQVEFWQGAADRKHLRLRYERDAAGWTSTRLWT